VGDIGEGLEVRHVEPRVTDRLDEEQAGTAVDRSANLVEVMDVDKSGRHAPFGEGVGEQIVGPAIQCLRGDQVVPRAGQVQNAEGRRGLAAGQCQRGNAVLELGDSLLEHVVGRIHDAGVDVAEYPEPEEIGGMLGVVEDVARRGVNGDSARVRRWIRNLAGVDCDGIGMVGHGHAPQKMEMKKARTTGKWAGPRVVGSVESTSLSSPAACTPKAPSTPWRGDTCE
jgi:hypothetical protein